jgi:uncharacterized membrane protein (DUF373 family)
MLVSPERRTAVGLGDSSAMTPANTASIPARTWIARAFGLVEDIVYVGLGLLLAGSALSLLIDGAVSFVHNIGSGMLLVNTIGLLDRILTILLVIELLYTVQVSFREHAVVPEPFLLVGLIAAIRRVLLLTAEFGHVGNQSESSFQHFVIELGTLTILIVALAFSLVLLRKRGTTATAERK